VAEPLLAFQERFGALGSAGKVVSLKCNRRTERVAIGSLSFRKYLYRISASPTHCRGGFPQLLHGALWSILGRSSSCDECPHRSAGQELRLTPPAMCKGLIKDERNELN
jgi:hypothetical protein